MPGIDNITLQRRTKDIEEELRRQNLQALLLYANGSALGNQSRMHGYMRYLCNFDGHNIPAMLILRPGHEPTLITGNKPYMRTQTAEKALWFKDVRHVASSLFGEEAAAILGPDTSPRRIAYMGYNETIAPVWKSLEQRLPGVEWVLDFARHFDTRRVQKSVGDLGLHRRAAEICDAIFETLAREVRTGKRSYQIQAAMEQTARHEGCRYCITWLTVSPRADGPRFYAEECLRVPEEGDQVLGGIYLTYDGHWGHAVRTGNFGQPSAEQRRIYDICRAMEDAALERLRSGRDLHEVNAAMDRVLHQHYDEKDVHRSRAGHGLGYSYEDPVVSAAFPNAWDVDWTVQKKPPPMEIKPGMLFELHPHLFVPGAAGAMIGDMVAVTETGNEILTKFPRDLAVW